MSIAEIKDSIKSLPTTERRELVAYLLHLEQTESPDFLDRITQKIDHADRFQKWSDVRELPEN